MTTLDGGALDGETEILRVLATGDRPAEAHLTDDLYRRIEHALGDSSATDLDLAVLLRHLLRRWSIRDGRPVSVHLAHSISQRIARHAAQSSLRQDSSGSWSATAWRPSWLVEDPADEATPDAAASAGTSVGSRFRDDPLAADPFFTAATGFTTYRTPGQRAACRAVVSSRPGSCTIAMLPTGSGKTEVALTLAKSLQQALTLLVVPTVALAYDFERRLRDHYARGRASDFDRNTLAFAWTASTDEAARDQFRERVRAGRQPILVTSPESVTRALRLVLSAAAGAGRLGAVVIDEAHLVTQWGRDFRPEFRTLASLIQQLTDAAVVVDHAPPKVLLLSATLGSRELLDLRNLFGVGRDCNLVAANALRAEPEMWVAHCDDEQERDRRVVDALRHLPRPAVLYVTVPDKADGWRAFLTGAGFGRVAAVTGRSTGAERARVLAGLRTDGEAASSVDLVVATSAFGLGIDYAHVRSVVHAALPETVDRWYQEIGRGGRDGDVSAAVLLTGPADQREARSLATTVIKPETARVRWIDLWQHRKTREDRSFVDLEGARGAVQEGSYNRRWNAQLVQGLVELGAIERRYVDAEDIAELSADDGRLHDWAALELVRPDLGQRDFWDVYWAPWQQAEGRSSVIALDAMTRIANREAACCGAVAAAYRPTAKVLETFPDAARGMEPTAPCGRCPGCRASRVPPVIDPPPRPAQRWPVVRLETPKLERLAVAAGAPDGLVLLTADDVVMAAGLLCAPLVRAGVKHAAGLAVDALPPGLDFLDTGIIGPGSLTPFPVFVAHPPGADPTHQWLSRKFRLAHRPSGVTYDVLLMSKGARIGGRAVGRDLPALDALTALEVLGG